MLARGVASDVAMAWLVVGYNRMCKVERNPSNGVSLGPSSGPHGLPGGRDAEYQGRAITVNKH